MRQIDAGAFRGFGVQPLAHPLILSLAHEEFTSEVQRVRGEQVTIPGEKVFLGGEGDVDKVFFWAVFQIPQLLSMIPTG